ncbi:hypothetical protein KOR42_47810 [Thalassoglobus neptunius]|uniref:N-terminal domain-containing protein n=1 Tax=Thalassoglobus neptunius TaxID=1938619 RepID=A0A5C5VT85_9PLAN|nr:ArdC-like ssDNA-binding domain-containing protein [Thalassoglobus neptunius]TWT41510.1 hypothetical protein KOR42_47810 [Thalassoglobus neptunius]
MNRQDAIKLSEKALTDLVGALKEGKSETLIQYLSMLQRFHHYSFGNIMMIFSQKQDAERVAGFHTWKKLGRIVKKGEKGIAIFAPMKFKQSEEQESDSEDEKVIRGFRVVHVFDISQTEGKPLAEFASIEGDPGENITMVRGLIESEGITLTYEAIPGGALGTSAGGAISIIPELEAAEEFAVLVHEFAHELLHRGDRRSETTKTLRETEAEAVSFVVCNAVGLDTSTRSSDYIQLYQGDEKVLSQSLDLIQKTASKILVGLEQDVQEEEIRAVG